MYSTPAVSLEALNHRDIAAIALIANTMFRLPPAGFDISKIFYFLEMTITLFLINVF